MCGNEGPYPGRLSVPSSPASRCGTGVSEPRQGASTPPGRSTQPHPQMSHGPVTMRAEHCISSLSDQDPQAMALPPSSPTQRRYQVLLHWYPLFLMSNSSLLPILSKNRWGRGSLTYVLGWCRESLPLSSQLTLLGSPRSCPICLLCSAFWLKPEYKDAKCILTLPPHLHSTTGPLLSCTPDHDHSPTTPLPPLVHVTGTSPAPPQATLHVAPRQGLPNTTGSRGTPGL